MNKEEVRANLNRVMIEGCWRRANGDYCDIRLNKEPLYIVLSIALGIGTILALMLYAIAK